jgi:uncharacterized protein (TIGR01244 family)
MRIRSLVAAPVAIVCLMAAPAGAQQVTKDTIPGIVNFARVETTVACGGSTKPEAVAEIKKLGFASIINLRLPEEREANIDAEAAAAKAAGIKFVHLPFNGTSPDPSVAGKFLDEITTPGTQPAYIHCGGGNRAAAMWLIKRISVDHWDADRATQEATALGLTSPALKQFAIDYAQSHKR